MANTKNHYFKNLSFFIVILVGFLQEASNGISMVALQFLYKDEFHLSPSDASFFDSISTIPWIIKPWWGFISDSFHLFGYRRKNYLIFFSLVQIFSWVLLLLFTDKLYVGIPCLFFLSLGGSFINVICEALIVEITQTNSNEKIEEEKQTKASETISTFFGARYFGTFLTVFSGGVLLENLTKQTVFAISANFAFLSGIASFFLYEAKKITETRNLKECLKEKQIKEFDNEETFKLNSKEITYIDRKIDDADEEANEGEDKKSESYKKIDYNEAIYAKLLRFFKQKQIFYPAFFIFLVTFRPSSNQAIFFLYKFTSFPS